MLDTATDIDRIDLKILNVLQHDGRISNLKLAESVALSPTAVLARVQRLSRDGYTPSASRGVHLTSSITA